MKWSWLFFTESRQGILSSSYVKEEDQDIDGSLLVSANLLLRFNLHFISPSKVEVSSIGLLVQLARQIPSWDQIPYLRN